VDFPLPVDLALTLRKSDAMVRFHLEGLFLNRAIAFIRDFPAYLEQLAAVDWQLFQAHEFVLYARQSADQPL